MNNNIFKTTELSFSVYLIKSGAKFVGVERINEKAVYFEFEDPIKCYKLEKEFLNVKQSLLDLTKNEHFENS
jgi:hypothetical protein